MFGKLFSTCLCVAAAFALAACQTAGERLTFDSADFMGSPVKRVSGQLFRPDDSAALRPAVILLHTCGGPAEHTLDHWPRFLNGLGYAVFTVDTLGSRGKESCSQVRQGYYLQAIDADHALDYLASLPFVDADRIAVMGFSMGAIAINTRLATDRYTRSKNEFRAGISLYGRCSSIATASDTRFPVLVLVGDQDPDHTPSCVAIADSRNFDVVVLKGAYHGFDQPSSRAIRYDPKGTPMAYSAAATNEAEALTKDFLARAFASPATA